MAAYQLPERASRGKRMRAVMEDEEAQADEEFWNQEFFAEEARDEDYKSEAEVEDVVDTDFDESESEEDEGDADADAERSPKRKVLKPPGAPPSRPRPPKPPGGPKPEPKPRAAAATGSEGPSGAAAAAMEISYEAPTLRESTKKRMIEAQKARQLQEALKPVRKQQQRGEGWRVMTQEEMLAEAARTELENLASLKQLLAQEEETKKKAAVVKKLHTGPMVRYRSRAVEQLLPPSQQQQQAQVLQPAPVVAVKADPDAQPAGQGAAAAGAAGTQQGTPSAAAGEAPAAAAAAAAAGGTPGPAAAAAGGGLADTPAAAAEGQAQPAAATAGAAEASEADKQAAAAAAAAAAVAEPAGPRLVKVEVSTLQPLNMKGPPQWLRPQRAPPPPRPALCCITGRPAKYQDPATGMYYADAAAFAEIRRRAGVPMPAARPPPPSAAELEQAAAMAAAAAAGGAAGSRGQGWPVMGSPRAAAGAGRGRGGGVGGRGAGGRDGGISGGVSVHEMPDEVVGLLLDVWQQFGGGQDDPLVAQPIGVV